MWSRAAARLREPLRCRARPLAPVGVLDKQYLSEGTGGRLCQSTNHHDVATGT
jgi:hypothetical protein